MNTRRRHTLLFALSLCSAPLRAQGQQAGKVYRIGVLSNAAPSESLWQVMIAGLRERGWIEGHNFTIDLLYSEGRNERFPALAAELVQRKVDLIIVAGTAGTAAAKAATSTIPIVFLYVGDPVGSGFVASLARPGGNLTGLGGLAPGVHAKQLELLKEAVPNASRIAMFVNPGMQNHAAIRADVELAARRLGVKLRPVEIQAPEELDPAFATMAREKIHALMILGQPLLGVHRDRLAKLALEHRMPAVIPFHDAAEAGVLMAYASRPIDHLRRLPYYVDRILKGTKPAELPVEQATRIYLTINLKTAKAIGLTVPPALLQRADQLIE